MHAFLWLLGTLCLWGVCVPVRALPLTAAQLEAVNSIPCYGEHGPDYWEALMARLPAAELQSSTRLSWRIGLLNAGLLATRPPRRALLSALVNIRPALTEASIASLPNGPGLAAIHPLLVCLRGVVAASNTVATMNRMTEYGRAANAAVLGSAEAAMVFDTDTLISVSTLHQTRLHKRAAGN